MRDVRSLILKGFLVELVFYFNIEKLTRRKRRKKERAQRISVHEPS